MKSLWANIVVLLGCMVWVASAMNFDGYQWSHELPESDLTLLASTPAHERDALTYSSFKRPTVEVDLAEFLELQEQARRLHIRIRKLNRQIYLLYQEEYP